VCVFVCVGGGGHISVHMMSNLYRYVLSHCTLGLIIKNPTECQQIQQLSYSGRLHMLMTGREVGLRMTGS